MVIELSRGGNFFAEPNAFSSSFETGVLKNRYGRRYVALTETFLQGFLEGIEIECGEAADEVLYTCGYEYGQIHARHLDEDFSRYYNKSARHFPMAEFTALLNEALSHDGWGLLKMDYTDHASGVFSASVEYPIYSSVVRGRGGSSDSLLAGLLAGVFSYFSEESLACLQTEGTSADDHVPTNGVRPTSRFVISGSDRIDEVREVLENGQGHDAVVDSLRGGVAA